MTRPLQFSGLSSARKALIRLCQSTNYGYIEDLAIRDREPIFSPPCTVLVDLKLDSEQYARPELAHSDFPLSGEVGRLMALLDQIRDGRISRLEVRAGLPRRIFFEKRIQDFANPLT